MAARPVLVPSTLHISQWSLERVILVLTISGSFFLDPHHLILLGSLMFSLSISL